MIFFSNPKVKSDFLLKTHYQQTVARIQSNQEASKYILLIQDGMRLNYTSHPAKTDLGRIGKQKNTTLYGLIQHSTLCVTDQNEPLGLIDLQHFHYDELDTSTHHHHRSVQDKATRYWLNALIATRARIGPCDTPLITVTDREGDFFEFLHALLEMQEKFVVRAKHNRHTGENYRARGERLHSLLDESAVRGQFKTMIQDPKTRKIKKITLKIKAIGVTLPPPNKSQTEKEIGEYQAIKVNAVKIYNEEHEWILLTSLPVDTLEDLIEIAKIYRSRWHIEDYHKVLKTGYQVDEIYLHSSREAVENLLVMASISACRLYWVVYVGRAEREIKSNQLFKDFEWKCLYVYLKEPVPKEPPVLSDVILRIARLGGYKPSKNGQPPGIKTLWIGFQKFTIAANMFKEVMSIKT